MPETLAAAMAVIPLRRVRRWSFIRSSLFDLDLSFADDRPPFLRLRFVERGQAVGRLQLARRDVESEVGEAFLYRRVGERRHHGAVQFGDRFLRRAFRRE